MSSPKEQASCSNADKEAEEGEAMSLEASRSSLVHDPAIAMDDEDTIELMPEDTEQTPSEDQQPTKVGPSYDTSEELTEVKKNQAKPPRRESESAIFSLKKKR